MLFKPTAMLFTLTLYLLVNGPEPVHAARKVVIKKPPRRGTVVVTVPSSHRVVRVGKTRYYFHDGVYYRKKPRGYVVVAPPRGAVVVGIPQGCKRVRVGGVVYYSWSGAWYKKAPGGYIVVQAPPEPSGAEPVYNVATPAATTGKAYVDVHLLNVRSGPGKPHAVTATVRKGDLLRIKGSENAWLYVVLPSGRFGWVMGKFTRGTPPANG